MPSALKAIHKHCLMCGNEQRGNSTKTCNYPACPLWPYRMGTRPADGSPHRPLKACRSFCVNECQAEQAQHDGERNNYGERAGIIREEPGYIWKRMCK